MVDTWLKIFTRMESATDKSLEEARIRAEYGGKLRGLSTTAIYARMMAFKREGLAGIAGKMAIRRAQTMGGRDEASATPFTDTQKPKSSPAPTRKTLEYVTESHALINKKTKKLAAKLAALEKIIDTITESHALILQKAERIEAENIALKNGLQEYDEAVTLKLASVAKTIRIIEQSLKKTHKIETEYIALENRI